MAERRGFVTGGTWCADHNKLVEVWPKEDMVVEILDESVEGGGSACNFAVDVRKLDRSMPVETIGVIGADEDGRILVRTAEENGIGREQLAVRSDVRTNYTDAYSVRSTGRRTHLYYAGTNELLSPEIFDFSNTRMRILHLGLPGIHRLMDNPFAGEANGWVHVLKSARRHGLETNMELVSTEAARLRSIIEPCLPHLDYLVINDYEVGALAGLQTSNDGVTDTEACRLAGERIMAGSSLHMLVVHFPAGAFHFARDGAVTFAPPVAIPPEEIKGANGAGDAFAAGMLYAVHEGWNREEALRLAHCAAAASLRSVATCNGVASVAECLALGQRWGWRQG